MTKKQHAILARYIRAIADDFGLKDWTFYLDAEPSPEGTKASIRPISGCKRAVIRVAWNFRDDDPKEQRDTIIHELLHCHHAPMQHMLTYDMKGYSNITEDERSIINTTFCRLMEYAVDGLASTIAPRYPLIEWGRS